MEEIYQVYVKLLNGKHRALNFNSPSVEVLSIKNRLFEITGIPIAGQRLITGTRNLSDSSFISIDGPNSFPVLHLLLRLCGGKGGFGSLLRGAATKAGQKKTNNFDACRDMSGRRLRHVNAEKKLEEWKAEAEERRLEKIAEDFIKKKAKVSGKKTKEGEETEKYVKKYREDSARCMEEVEKSVREALGKRKLHAGGAGGSDTKKLKIWMGKRKLGNSDSDDSDEDDSGDDEEEENDNSVVLDNGNHSGSNKEGDGSSDSVTGGKFDGDFSAGGSSENCSEGDEETTVRGTSFNSESSDEGMITETVIQDEGVSFSEVAVVSGPEAVDAEKKVKPNDIESGSFDRTIGQPPVISSSREGESFACETTDAEANLDPESKSVIPEETVSMSRVIEDLVKEVNFDEFNSSVELEDLGMERLKSELQSRGLKFGGTLQERAARLFLLKTTPLEMLPKKLLAKK